MFPFTLEFCILIGLVLVFIVSVISLLILVILNETNDNKKYEKVLNSFQMISYFSNLQPPLNSKQLSFYDGKCKWW